MSNGQSFEDKLIEDLRDKIKAKMDVAKILGAFLTVLVSGSLAVFGDPTRLSTLLESSAPLCLQPICVPLSPIASKATLLLGVTSLFLAIILYFATVYAYDRLLMPGYFWKGNFDSRILYAKMVKAWAVFFNPASFFVMSGLFLLALTLLRLGLLEIVMMALMIGMAVFYCYYHRDIEVVD